MPDVLKRTPLFAAHQSAGAKLVDFGGWEMPLHYGSQIDEHHAVRRNAGMFDVSHMRAVEVHGAGAAAFLRYAVANNIDKLTTPGRALYSCMLNADGGVIDDLIIYFMDEDWFRIVVNAGTADKDIAWMTAQRDRVALRDKTAPALEITPRRDLAMIAVQGPSAAAKLWNALPGSQALTETLKPFNAVVVGQMFIARTGYTGEDGFEVMMPAKAAPFFWQSLLDEGAVSCGLGARDTLRLEAGMNLYGQDMDETQSPLESGLAWTVDLKSERDFIGKAALQSRDINYQMVGLILQDKGVLRSHQKVFTKHGEGEITSGSFSPTLQQSIALARVPLGIAPGETVEVDIRDKRLKALVKKYPFVRNGKSLI